MIRNERKSLIREIHDVITFIAFFARYRIEQKEKKLLRENIIF
jgi:hypothetical protein